MFTQKLRRLTGKALLVATMLLGATLSVSAAAPQITGYNIKEGATLFAAQCDTLKVYYDRPVVSATYEFRQNGKVIFQGADNGAGQGQNLSIFGVNTKTSYNDREVCIALAVDKTLVPGEVEFAVTSVTYMEGDDEVTAYNLGSVKWNLTDLPRVGGANPMWHPSEDLKELKTAYTNISFTFPELNFGSYYDEAQGKKAYVKTQIKGGKISLLQDGEVKTVFDIVKPEPSTGIYNNQLPNQKLTAEQAAVLKNGTVEIRLTELTYISPCDGEDKTVSDPEGLPTTWTQNNESGSLIPERALTYVKFAGPPTTLESESIENLKAELLSYYAEDDMNGVFSYTFTEPLAAGTDGKGDFQVYFRIGDANNTFDNPVPHTLSEDHKTITVDLRGIANGVPTLAKGHNFADENGNAYIPATCTIYVGDDQQNKIFDEKGRKVSIYTVFEEGVPGRYLEGKLFRRYKYKEISFANPAISNPLFYNSETPENKSENMVAGSNTMDVTVSNSEVIESADAVFLVGTESVAAEATHEGDTWTVGIPATVIEKGLEGVSFALENVVYNRVDGNEHTVAPLDLSAMAPILEVSTLAEVVALEPNTEVILNTTGVLVTMNHPMLTSVEDTSAAVMLADANDGELEFATGTMLTGTLHGVYADGNMFAIDLTKSEFTQSEADASAGFDVVSAEDLAKPELAFRLLTLSAEDGFTFTPVEDDEQIVAMVNGSIPVMDAGGIRPEGYVCPDQIKSVTGVYYVMEETGMLLIRTTDDIAAVELPEVNSVAELVEIPEGTRVKFNMNDVKVTYANEQFVFMEQGDAAIGVQCDEDQVSPFTTGKTLNGTLEGVVYSNHLFMVDLTKSNYTEAEADVTEGASIAPAACQEMANAYRLVTFRNTPATPIALNEDYGVMMVGNMLVIDQFGALADDYEYPEYVESLTGIVINFPDSPMGVFLQPRSANDIVAGTPVPVVENHNDLKGLEPGSQVILKVTDAAVTLANEQMVLLQDETGGINLVSMDEENPIALERGTSISGSLLGMYVGGCGFVVNLDDSNFTQGTADVSQGHKLNLDEVFNANNQYRLVTFKHSDETPIQVSEQGIVVGENIFVQDRFGAFDEDGISDYTIESLTGILFFPEIMEMADDDAVAPAMAILIPRDAADVVTKQAGIESILGDVEKDTPIYNINGVKVREAGQGLKGLSKGIYIINGKKVLVF